MVDIERDHFHAVRRELQRYKAGFVAVAESAVSDRVPRDGRSEDCTSLVGCFNKDGNSDGVNERRWWVDAIDGQGEKPSCWNCVALLTFPTRTISVFAPSPKKNKKQAARAQFQSQDSTRRGNRQHSTAQHSTPSPASRATWVKSNRLHCNSIGAAIRSIGAAPDSDD